MAFRSLSLHADALTAWVDRGPEGKDCILMLVLQTMSSLCPAQ